MLIWNAMTTPLDLSLTDLGRAELVMDGCCMMRMERSRGELIDFFRKRNYRATHLLAD